MATLRQHETYQWYTTKAYEDLNLPEIGQDANGDYELLLGELFCRAPGCHHNHKFGTTNALRKHYDQAHSELILSGAIQGGRPSAAEQNKAIEFYEYLKQIYDEQHADDLPELPRKRDGTINLTQMRAQVREMGHDIPCDSCREARHSCECCKEIHKDTCDHFELFHAEDN